MALDGLNTFVINMHPCIYISRTASHSETSIFRDEQEDQGQDRMSSRGSRLQRSGLHLPDEFYEKPKYSAAKVILITRLVFTAIVRLIYGVISAIIATIYYFTLVALLEPMRHLAEPLYWYLVGLIFKKLQLIVGCWMWSGGYKGKVCLLILKRGISVLPLIDKKWNEGIYHTPDRSCSGLVWDVYR